MPARSVSKSIAHARLARLTHARQDVSHLRRDGDPALVRTFGLIVGRGSIAPPHVEGWAQLVTARRGRAFVRTGHALFPLVGECGVTVPAGLAYSIESAGQTEIRTIYLRRSGFAPNGPALVETTPLLRELIGRTIELGALDGRIAAHRRLAAVVYDEVDGLRERNLLIPLPAAGVARSAVEALLVEAAGGLGPAGAARICGVSRRTLERAFARDAGIGLALWLRRIRLIQALYALHEGSSVTGAALAAGYSGPSAFIAAFRRQFGTTPRASFKAR
jgi:AraC-like DNA-binding protein